MFFYFPFVLKIKDLLLRYESIYGARNIYMRRLDTNTEKTSFTVNLRTSARGAYFILGSLSTRVFETRTATGSELSSLLTCPHTTTFTLLSILSPLEMNSIKIWETIRSKNANCSLPDAVRVSKTRVLKLPT